MLPGAPPTYSGSRVSAADTPGLPIPVFADLPSTDRLITSLVLTAVRENTGLMNIPLHITMYSQQGEEEIFTLTVYSTRFV